MKREWNFFSLIHARWYFTGRPSNLTFLFVLSFSPFFLSLSPYYYPFFSSLSSFSASAFFFLLFCSFIVFLHLSLLPVPDSGTQVSMVTEHRIEAGRVPRLNTHPHTQRPYFTITAPRTVYYLSTLNNVPLPSVCMGAQRE